MINADSTQKVINDFERYVRRGAEKDELKAAESINVVDNYYGGYIFTCSNGASYNRAIDAISMQVKLDVEKTISLLMATLTDLLNECEGKFESNVLVSARMILDGVDK